MKFEDQLKVIKNVIINEDNLVIISNNNKNKYFIKTNTDEKLFETHINENYSLEGNIKMLLITYKSIAVHEFLAIQKTIS